MKLEILPDAEAVAAKAATLIAAEARATVAERGSFTFAVSGGTTPWEMLRALAEKAVPWEGVHVLQVDERVVPAGDPERNLTHLRENLVARAPIPEDHVYPMPVEQADLAAAAARYAETIVEVASDPPVVDLVHLGLGRDGHTASLVPGDPVLEVRDADVAVTAGPYQGCRRMTLTYPLLARARRILWLVTGAPKAEMLARLRDGDASIPAGRVRADRAVIMADRGVAT